MYLTFFGLREMPFSITPDPAYLYMSPRHQEALGHLLYGTGQYGGFVQLTGEVGTGKTTVVRTLLAQKIEGVDVAMVHNPRQSEREFLASICDELGVVYTADASLKALVDALNQHLLAAHAKGRRTVLIIDEAQNLAPGVLEQVRLLTNLETHKEKLLRIMLIGQPELTELLGRPDLRQLAQRITARYHLTPLSEPETAEYVRHRLRVAGGDARLFTDDALQAVHAVSGGVPRLINVVCDRALLGAYSTGQGSVSAAMVRQAAAESLEGVRPERRKGPGRRAADRVERRWRLLELGLASLAVLLSSVLLWRTWQLHREPAPVAAPTPPAAAVVPSPMPAPSAGLEAYSQPLSTLFRRVLALWDPALRVESVTTACAELRPLGYECHRDTADWPTLKRMDLPAILELEVLGFRKHVALAWLSENEAGLLTASGEAKAVPLEVLDEAWGGQFLLIWKRPTRDRRIDRNSRGDDVVWLRKRLAQVANRTLTPPISGFFDAALEETVRAYQAASGLQPDGVAGVQTLIALTRGDPGVPTLSRPADVAAP